MHVLVISTIAKWGPTYKISLTFRIKSWPQRGQSFRILSFTSSSGDQVPFIEVKNEQRGSYNYNNLAIITQTRTIRIQLRQVTLPSLDWYFLQIYQHEISSGRVRKVQENVYVYSNLV